MKEEIFSGLKIAIERGANIDSAVQSFINAGYNPIEVKEAANMIASGSSSFLTSQVMPNPEPSEKSEDHKLPSANPAPTQTQTQTRPQTQTQNPQQLQRFQLGEKKSSKGWKIAIISLIILITLLGVFAISLLIFKEKLIEFILP